MRVAWFLMACVLLAGCSSFGNNTLEKELSARQESLSLNNQLKQHFESGEKQYAEGKLELAETEFKAILALKPEEENALYRLGTIAFKRGRYDASADYFERTIKSNPRNGKAHYNLASIRLMQSENHFKYYAALAGNDQDLSNVTMLLGDIDTFTSNDKQSDKSASLDKIAGALKK